MEDKDTKELTLASSMQDIEEKLRTTEDADELDKTVIPLFNTNLKKQNMMRQAKVSELLDLTLNQMAERIITTPFDFNNKELLEYYKVMQDVVSKPINMEEVPSIQINNNITVDAKDDVETLNRASRAKVTSVIDQILEQAKQSTEDENEIVDVVYEEEELDD